MSKRPNDHRPLQVDESKDEIILLRKKYSLSEFKAYLKEDWSTLVRQHFVKWHKAPDGLAPEYNWTQIFHTVNRSFFPILMFLEKKGFITKQVDERKKDNAAA